MAPYSPVVPIFFFHWYTLLPDLSLFSSSHVSPVTLSGRKMNTYALLLAPHAHAPLAATYLCFFGWGKWKRKAINSRAQKFRLSPFLICVQVIEWVRSPAELTSRHSSLLFHNHTRSHALYSANGFSIVRKRQLRIRILRLSSWDKGLMK